MERLLAVSVLLKDALPDAERRKLDLLFALGDEDAINSVLKASSSASYMQMILDFFKSEDERLTLLDRLKAQPWDPNWWGSAEQWHLAMDKEIATIARLREVFEANLLLLRFDSETEVRARSMPFHPEPAELPCCGCGEVTRFEDQAHFLGPSSARQRTNLADEADRNVFVRPFSGAFCDAAPL